MLNVYDRNRNRLQVLQNAIAPVEYERLNNVSELTFTLPAPDPKNEFCRPFNLVRWGNTGLLHRIVNMERILSKDGELATYTAEHAVTTLLDTVLFGTVQLDNLSTRAVLQTLLNRQPQPRAWVLGDCEFERFFSYAWSNENLLAAVFSIPNRFDESYRWDFDTSGFPWVLHLRRLRTDIEPQYRVIQGYNLMRHTLTRKGREVANRIYALGYGEGVNQLTLREVSGGVPYVEDRASIAKYGVHETIWTDLRFEDPAALLQRAKVLLKSYAEPYESWEIGVADLEKITGREIDRAAAGKIVQYEALRTYVVEVERHFAEAGKDRVTLANAPQDVAGTIADLADRQRIGSVYANGATNIYAQPFADNASAAAPAVLDFFVPAEARIINAVLLKIRLERFRAYSVGAESTETVSRSTSSGGATRRTSSTEAEQRRTSSSTSETRNTSSGGGGTTTATAGDGGENITSGPSSQLTSGMQPSFEFEEETSAQKGSGSSHYHEYVFFTEVHRHDIDHTHNVKTSNHTHSVRLQAHTHEVTIPGHNHEVTIRAHNHTVDIPDHVHQVTIPGHTHATIYGIYQGPRANAVTITVDGKAVPIAANQTEVDLVNYLSVDQGSGKIRRGVYHTIEIAPVAAANNPDGLSRIVATVTVQLFIQSQGGGTY